MADTRNEVRHLRNEETRPYATNHKQLWDSSDIGYILQNAGKQTTYSLALAIGRTYDALQTQAVKRHISLVCNGNSTSAPTIVSLPAALQLAEKMRARGIHPVINNIGTGYVVKEAVFVAQKPK